MFCPHVSTKRMALLSISALILGLAAVPPAVATTATGDKDWNLSNSLGGDGELVCTYGAAGDGAVSGDWDGNGTDTPGVFRDGTWHLADSCGGTGELTSSFGDVGDKPVVGDWDGNGTDTPGFFREGVWYLSDDRSGEVDHQFAFGLSTDTPVVGDWNGDGMTTVGVWRDGTWQLTDSLEGGVDHGFTYGATGDAPVVGDWNGDGRDTPGVVSGAEWSLSDVLGGTGDHQFSYGVAGDQPVPGDWDGDGTVTAGVAQDGADEALLTAESAAAAKVECGRTPIPANPPSGTSYKFGGGAGYPDIVTQVKFKKCPGEFTVVRKKSKLKETLDDADPGDVVYVRDSAKFDFTSLTKDHIVLHVPNGVTLASGRGRQREDGTSRGALLKTTVATEGRGMISVGTGARITGLRIQGHNDTNCIQENYPADPGETCVNSRGIVATGESIEVDNVEIFDWTYAGIALAPGEVDVIDTHIHHNYFHHNRKQEAGYGVVLDTGTSEALVEWNRFNYNRHAVAGNGGTKQSYEARYNLVLSESEGHIFDMHGDPAEENNPERIAGTDIRIHHNYILHTRFASVLVRGIPEVGSWTWSNCMARERKIPIPDGEEANFTTYTIAQAIAQPDATPDNPDDAELPDKFYPTGTRFFVDQKPGGAPGDVENEFGRTAEQCGVAKDLR